MNKEGLLIHLFNKCLLGSDNMPDDSGDKVNIILVELHFRCIGGSGRNNK